MGTNAAFCNNHVAEEEYIDMEISPSSSPFCSSPQGTREFEFQMCQSISLEKDTTTSPADELFYKGKLLPLHLPPRLQMVEKLLQNPIKTFQKDENFTPFTNNSTPFDQSCNISPSESCRVSSELNPDEYFFDWSTELNGFNFNGDHQSKKSWSKKKLKMIIKQSSFGQKIKSLRPYLKSLFTKSGCSDDSCGKRAGYNEKEGNKDYLSKYINVVKKCPSDQIGKGTTLPTLATIMSKETSFDQDNVGGSHRKSFSGAIKRRSAIKCLSSSSNSSSASSSSSSFPFNSNGFYDLQFLKRSCSAASEIDNSIEAAIAHCKKSQQMLSSRKTVNENGFCSFTVSRTAASSNGDQEKSGVCL